MEKQTVINGEGAEKLRPKLSLQDNHFEIQTRETQIYASLIKIYISLAAAFFVCHREKAFKKVKKSENGKLFLLSNGEKRKRKVLSEKQIKILDEREKRS
jgi:hypothetical protein